MTNCANKHRGNSLWAWCLLGLLAFTLAHARSSVSPAPLSAAQSGQAKSNPTKAKSPPGKKKTENRSKAAAAGEPDVLKAPREINVAKNYIKLTSDLRANRQAFVISASNVTIDGDDGHGGRRLIEWNADGLDDCYAIYVFGGSSPLHQKVQKSTALPAIRGGRKADSLTIKNCHFRIIGKKGDGGEELAKRCHAIGGPSLAFLKIENCVVETAGEDAHTIYSPESSAVNSSATLLGNLLIADQRSTANRHQGPANVRVVKLVARGNVLIGGNSGFNFNAAGSKVFDNVIAHKSYATNGYGCFCYKPQGVLIENNLIIPDGGRGVILNGWEKNDMRNLSEVENVVRNNVIFVTERPNAEYEESLRPKGILARWQQPFIRIEDNLIVGLAGGEFTDVYALQFHIPDDSRGEVSRNACMALRLNGNHRHAAKTLTLEGQGASDIQIHENEFLGNHYLIATAGYEPGCRQRAPLVANTLAWCDGSQAWARFVARADALLASLEPEDAAAEKTSSDTKKKSASMPTPTTGPKAREIWQEFSHRLAPQFQNATIDRNLARTLLTGRWYGTEGKVTEERLTILNSKGDAPLELTDVVNSVPTSAGQRHFEVGHTGADGKGVIDYWIGRQTGAAGEPYTKNVP